MSPSTVEKASCEDIVSRYGTHPRILIVRPSALGDVARTVAGLVTLRRGFPEARIDWLVNSSFADVVRHHPDLSEVISFPRSRFSRIPRDPRVALEAWRWVGGLRDKRYDVVFDLQGLFRSGVITLLTRARWRVGYSDARECGWVGYNRRHRVDPGLHAVDRGLSLLQAEGFHPCRDMRVYCGSQEAEWADDWVNGHIGSGGRYFCIAPTARWRSKCWPLEKYAQVASRLLRNGAGGDHLVIIAGPGEDEQVQRLVESLKEFRGRVWSPRTTIGQMMGLIRRTRLLICNDSAPLHIAVGFDRAIVAIFGPTDPGLVGPYLRSETVVAPMDRAGATGHYRRLRDDQTLISRVTVERVWEKILVQLEGS